MLIYLEEVHQIINTDSIENVCMGTDKNNIDESFLNLEPEADISVLEEADDTINIHLRNGSILTIQSTVLEFWEMIKCNI